MKDSWSNGSGFDGEDFDYRYSIFSGEQGNENITLADAKKWVSYSDNTWSRLNNWTITEDTTFPFLQFPYVTDFSIASGENGTDVTLANAKKQTTYENNTWTFAPWDIEEDVSYPTLLQNATIKVYLNDTWTDYPITVLQDGAWVYSTVLTVL
jgi:hypothetical protein